MNVIIANKQKDAFADLNVDVSERLDGEFDADEIIKSFSNFFYNKMFLDITAIKDYKDFKNIQKLSIGLDVTKLILLLDNDDVVNSAEFLSKLISVGIYNFTHDANNLMYLYNNPNSYRDVAHLQRFDSNVNNINNDNNNFNNSNFDSSNIPNVSNVNSKFILGVKNVTDNAGATTLIYILKKVLSDYYNVCAIEINKRDFLFLKDSDTFSIIDRDIDDTLNKCNKYDIILVDLNNASRDDFTNDILYLVEPSTIKLSKLSTINPTVFNGLTNKKIVLNKSLFSSSDVKDLEREACIKVFYSLPYLDDRNDNRNVIIPLLAKLHLVNEEVSDDNDGIKISDLFKL